MERNHDMWDKELLDIKAAFEEWLHLLEETYALVQTWTAHKNLEHLQTTQLNQCQIYSILFHS